MDKVTQKCHKCEKEFKYNEKIDVENNDLVPKKIRKVIVDDKGQSFPFYAMPKDKQRLVNQKFVKFECSRCFIPAETK